MRFAILVLLLFTAPVRGYATPDKDALVDKPIPRGNFLVRPFRDKPVAILAAIQVATVTWDNATTRISENRGSFEMNPLMRPFAHNSASLIAEGAASVWLSAFVADRMKHSRSIVLRKTWWLPQVVNFSFPLYGGIHNTVVLNR
jgi:hypothetical protein